ncbi:hypothetical protein LPB86_11330 [Pedobacter sp. MC2016-14]|uniref:glycoside hydrolase family 28 protein n=1 Tax=Pedobacter sp. MC2016-14 TaxID=2897327 RepID=UPI001E55BAA1|nr:glycosyl hydrolase family 28 protein [Pedobacter sp. MC2016-14]MCD0488826.1 hypothetical protein [Pedobacter sp. MC2016-14]
MFDKILFSINYCLLNKKQTGSLLVFCFIYSSVQALDYRAIRPLRPETNKMVFAEFGYNVNDFGAVGDGKTINTVAIQKAVDQCSLDGGGMVYFTSGVYVSGTIYLKSNVVLHIPSGITLKASSKIDDFPDQNSSLPTHNQPNLTSKALIYAEGKQSIAITGLGTIDGNGRYLDLSDDRKGRLKPSFKYRPRILHIRNCENILIEDIKLFNAASWVQTYQECQNLIIRGIKVDSKENPVVNGKQDTVAYRHRNTDGLDLIDCRFVSVSDAHISSGDDAICIKSFSPDKICSNITISNCNLSSNTSGLKIGTETAGTIQDIVIQNCTVYDTKGEGIAIISVDGATVRRVSISNIILNNIKRSAIFIRLHQRNTRYGAYTYSNKPGLKDIMINNIQGSRLSSLGCSVSGIKNFEVENVNFSNVHLEFEGLASSQVFSGQVPELPNGYPKGDMFGILPSFGFYIRNVKGIRFNNVDVKSLKHDSRPAIVIESVKDFSFISSYVQGDAVKDKVLSSTTGIFQINATLQKR